MGLRSQFGWSKRCAFRGPPPRHGSNRRASGLEPESLPIGGVSRDYVSGVQILSRSAPYAVLTHGGLTSRFVGSATRRVRHGSEPPQRCVNSRPLSYERDETAAWLRLLAKGFLALIRTYMCRDQPLALQHRTGMPTVLGAPTKTAGRRQCLGQSSLALP